MERRSGLESGAALPRAFPLEGERAQTLGGTLPHVCLPLWTRAYLALP